MMGTHHLIPPEDAFRERGGGSLASRPRDRAARGAGRASEVLQSPRNHGDCSVMRSTSGTGSTLWKSMMVLSPERRSSVIWTRPGESFAVGDRLTGKDAAPLMLTKTVRIAPFLLM